MLQSLDVGTLYRCAIPCVSLAGVRVVCAGLSCADRIRGKLWSLLIYKEWWLSFLTLGLSETAGLFCFVAFIECLPILGGSKTWERALRVQLNVSCSGAIWYAIYVRYDALMSFWFFSDIIDKSLCRRSRSRADCFVGRVGLPWVVNRLAFINHIRVSA